MRWGAKNGRRILLRSRVVECGSRGKEQEQDRVLRRFWFQGPEILKTRRVHPSLSGPKAGRLYLVSATPASEEG
jgi:hypothetical protein